MRFIDGTGLPSGTVYLALRRMEAAGLIESGWECKAAQASTRPPYNDVLQTRRERFDTLAPDATEPTCTLQGAQFRD